MKIEDTLPADLLDVASRLLEDCKVDPKKLDPDLDGIPANTKDKEGATQLPAEPSNLKPNELEKKLDEAAVSDEPILDNPSLHKAADQSLGTTGEGVQRGIAAEPSHLDPSHAEKMMEEWIEANRQRFMEAYGVDGEKILYSTAYAMKENISVQGGLSQIVAPEAPTLKPDHAEDLMKEDDEDDASHGKEASGKVANADSIARESVEVVSEELDKNLDPQTGEIADRNRPPKGAHLVHEQSVGARGMRMQLEWANGKALILPPASEAPLFDIAACLEYVAEHFADRPDWIEAIEKSLLD